MPKIELDDDRRQEPDGQEPDGQDPDATNRRFRDGSARMDRIEANQHVMGAEQSAMRAEVSEVLEILRLGKSFFKLAGYIGSFVKWSAAVGAPVVAFYFAIKGGGKS